MDRLLGGWGAIFFFFFLSFLVTGLSETEISQKSQLIMDALKLLLQISARTFFVNFQCVCVHILLGKAQ